MPSKFDFISPDIVLREVDQSQVPTIQDVTDPGVVIIGQSSFGPSMKPIRVDSILKLDETFGEPKDGSDSASDIWRSGNNQLPHYGLFAARAWLSTNISPVTFIRLAGEDSPVKGGGYVNAGWNTGEAIDAAAASNSSAYGLFVIPSASSGTSTGTLAAILYAQSAALSLSGTIAGSTDTTASVGVLMASNSGAGSYGGFELQIDDGTTTTTKKFHLDPDNTNGFIRDALNTNPQALNSINLPAGSTEKYFLGETFETEVFEVLTTAGSASAGEQYAILLPLASGSYTANNLADHNREAAPAKTGWFISREPAPQAADSTWDSSTMKKLFRLVSLHDGKEFQDTYSVRIKDLKLGTTSQPDSTFTVEIINNLNGDVEQFSLCNLNQSSDNFIGKKIGDQYLEWNDTSEKYILYGNYENKSNLVRVEMANDWVAGIDDDYALPFGFYGPAKLKGFTITSGSAELNAGEATAYVVSPGASAIYAGHDAASQFAKFTPDVTASIVYPEFRLTTENTNAENNYKYTEYFGVRHGKSTEETGGIMDKGDYKDLAFPLGNDLDIHVPQNSSDMDSSLETSFIFTLDEIRKDSNGKFYYEAGSMAAGNSYTQNSGSSALLTTEKVKQFAAPFFGGSNGTDITLTDPFSSVSTQAITDSTTATTHYAHYSVEKAIEMIKDPDVIEYDVVAMPGLVNTDLRRLLVRNTEARGDALAVIDPASGFKQAFENSGTVEIGNVDTAITDVETNIINLDSSYAACYYPPVKLGVPYQKARVPSSVVGIGVIAQSEQASGAPWFAPAGFNRGGISTLGGTTGVKVASSIENLNKADRDELYQVNINPIARFPNEGLVVFGQKTLQLTPSALDRVNVRRLMIYLKKRIGAVARTILFDNNVNATWNRFKADAQPILIDAQSRFGISEFRLILDETTTTPDYIDRNILYAKVFIKPAYAIEFIAIDFNITRSGIEF